jgi:hypothetical protein
VFGQETLTKTLLHQKQPDIKQGLPVKKKTLLTGALISWLLLSTIAGTQFVNLGVANPYGAETEYTTPPIISVHSPVNNETSSNVLLNFTVTKPSFWLIHGGIEAQQILKSVRYQLDEKYYDPIPVNSGLKSPFDYSVNLTNLEDGVHSLKVYAFATGWVIEIHSLWEYEVPINSSSDAVYFTVDATPPTILVLPVENKTYGTSEIPLNFTLNEPTSQITYSLDGQANVTITGNTTLTGLSDGVHSVTVYATDNAGNIGASKTIIFNVEAPELFPVAPVAAASVVTVAVVGVGLLVLLRKRHREAVQS